MGTLALGVGKILERGFINNIDKTEERGLASFPATASFPEWSFKSACFTSSIFSSFLCYPPTFLINIYIFIEKKGGCFASSSFSIEKVEEGGDCAKQEKRQMGEGGKGCFAGSTPPFPTFDQL